MFQTFDVATNPQDGPLRVARLREAMAKAGVDAFVIPRTDIYRGETVAPCDERLSWLTGFTGSAGLAIITADAAALFVDGRYTLQARDQVAMDVFTIKNIPADEPSAYVAEVLGKGAKLGFDPWLMVRSERQRYIKRLSAKGIDLKATENLVDQIWDDRPPAPLAPVVPHPEKFAGEGHQDKRERLAKTLRADGLSAAVLTVPQSIAWLLNVRGGDVERSPVPHVTAILHDDAKVDLFISPEKRSEALQSHLGASVRLHAPDAFEAQLAALKGNVLVDPARASIAVVDALKAAEPVFRRDPCILPCSQKNDVEIAGTKAAQRRDGVAMIEFLAWFDKAAPDGKLTEIDVARQLEEFRRASEDLCDISFETISGSGPNGAIVHYRVNEATNRAVEPNSLMLVDSGGQYLDGTTDITRTMVVGKPPKGAARAFTMVLKGMIGLSAAKWPEGLAGRDIDAFARAALWQAGLDYDHGTGHGVGSYLSVHEGPASISRRSHEPIKPGMILSNEPGYYREGAFGIRIENLVLALPPSEISGGDRPMMGFETLTYVPIDRRLIDADLLSEQERAWLNDYHAETRQRFEDLVSDDAKDWLVEVTQPI